LYTIARGGGKRQGEHERYGGKTKHEEGGWRGPDQRHAAMPVQDVIAALGKAAAEINAELGAKLEPQ
jgi:hypothetical protein